MRYRRMAPHALMELGLLCLSLGVMISCLSNKPSDGEVKEFVSEVTSSLSKMGAKMVDFRKLNGESKEIFGQKMYVYQFLAAFELPSGVAWKTGLLSPQFVRDLGPRACGSIMDRCTSLPQGTTAVMRGTINYRSTEKGWVRQDPNWEFGYCTDLKAAACYKKLGWDVLR